MVYFIPVRYAHTNYPDYIEPKIQEVTANFGREKLENTKRHPYLSLHTDPSIIWYANKRNKIISSEVLKHFPTIRKNILVLGHAGLWCNQKWSKEFSGFLLRQTNGIDRKRVKIIEIHTPFNNSCNNLLNFIDIYKIFEDQIMKEFPSTEILIENMFNNIRKRNFGKFLLSTTDDLLLLSNLISKSNLKLRIVLDIPQLLSEHNGGNTLLTKKIIRNTLSPIREIRHLIKSIHIWGYDTGKQRGAHSSDFNVYFNNDKELKQFFLQEIYHLFDDGMARYFVPEVYSSTSVHSIVNDLRSVGFVFIES
jgi:hypothetical protein